MTPTIARDLYPAFAATTIRGPQDWSMGYDVIRDAKYDPDCGFMLECEAEILRECATRSPGLWLDIGARTGWTSAHIRRGDPKGILVAVDPGFRLFWDRFIANMRLATNWDANSGDENLVLSVYETSEEFFSRGGIPWTGGPRPFNGVCIDGDHDAPQPLNDARNALAHLDDTGVIVLHDFWAHPVRQAVEYLMRSGMKCRFYDTPAGLAVCWRGNFTPPEFTPDPAIDWASLRRDRAPDFNFGACL